MNILITGAGGYIGAKLTQFLAWQQHKVVCFDNFFFNHKSLVEDVFDRPNCKLYEEDVTEWSDTLKREIKNADVIFPLAALVGAPLCDKFPQETLDLNQNWFNKLLDYVDNQVIIYPNTNSGYGSTGTEICTEETPCNPLSLYGKTKGEAERILLEDYDNAVCFRLATVYGRSHRQRMDLLVNNLVYSSMVNKRLEVFDGHFRRNYIHVDDIVSAFVHALDNFESMRGEVYNLGNDSVNMSKLDLVKKICHETRAEWSEVQDKTDPDKRDYVVSSQKLYDTGFKPVYNLDYGIRQMMMVCSENWQNFANEAYMNMCKNY
jgi:nucleoside-diphosphate-sugar epimerase